MTADASVASRFAQLAREHEACVNEVIAVARHATAATAATWRAIVEATTGKPPEGFPPAGDGANPAEVRDVLLAIHDRYDRRLRALEHGAVPADLADEIWTFRHRRLASFVADEVAAYIRLVNPLPSVASVFAKAASAARSTGTARAASSPNIELHRCKTCSAPRLAEALYGACLYCGNPFFTGREEVD